jgi:hypothetical protein
VSETEKTPRDVHDALGHALAGRVPAGIEPYPPAPDPGREGEAERLRVELGRVRAELVRLHAGLGEAQAALENVVAGLRALTTAGPPP